MIPNEPALQIEHPLGSGVRYQFAQRTQLSIFIALGRAQRDRAIAELVATNKCRRIDEGGAHELNHEPKDGPDSDAAVEWMRRWPTERMHLWFKQVDAETGKEGVSQGRTYERTDDGYAAMRNAIDGVQGRGNIYYLVNDPHDDVTMDEVGKPAKAQMKRVVALHCDIDGREGETPEAVRARIEAAAEPTFEIVSGGGIQLLWLLKEPVLLKDAETINDIELRNLKLAEEMDGDKQVRDVCRILRLPGTINIPTAKKRARGRVPAPAYVLRQGGRADWSLAAFPPSKSKRDEKPAKGTKESKDKSKTTPEQLAELLSGLDAKDYRERERWWPIMAAAHHATGGDGLEPFVLWSTSDEQFAAEGPSIRREWTTLKPGKDNGYTVATIIKALQDAGRKDLLEKVLGHTGTSAGAETLDEMNDQFFVAPINGKTRVVTLGEDPDFPGQTTIIMAATFEDFKNLHNNRRVVVGQDAEGHPITVGRGTWWINHPHRRQYNGGMRFMPTREKEVVGETLNSWRGFAVDATKPEGMSGAAGCKLFLDHGRNVICSGNEEHFDYLMKREAFIAQKRRRSEVAVGLHSEEERTGKGFWEKHLGRLYGPHYMEVNHPDHLIGKHNEHLEKLLKVHADEAVFAGDPRHRNAIFGLITEPTITVEPKFIGAYKAANHLNLDFASNSKHFLPVGPVATRFFVPTVSSAHARDFEYFARIEQQLVDEGGYQALLYHLLHEIDLRSFNVREVPMTEGLRKQAALSLKGVDLLVQEACSTASVPCGHSTWSERSLVEGSYGFDEFIRRHKDRELSDLGPTRVKNRLREDWGCVTGEGARTWNGERNVSTVIWPPLEDLRARFVAKYGPQHWLHPVADHWLAGHEQGLELENPKVQAWLAGEDE